MVSFIHNRFNVFKNVGETNFVRQCPYGTMRSYSSVTDNRSWCNEREEYRQFMLQQIYQDNDYSPPKRIQLHKLAQISLADEITEIQLQEDNQKFDKYANFETDILDESNNEEVDINENRSEDTMALRLPAFFEQIYEFIEDIERIFEKLNQFCNYRKQIIHKIEALKISNENLRENVDPNSKSLENYMKTLKTVTEEKCRVQECLTKCQCDFNRLLNKTKNTKNVLHNSIESLQQCIKEKDNFQCILQTLEAEKKRLIEEVRCYQSYMNRFEQVAIEWARKIDLLIEKLEHQSEHRMTISKVSSVELKETLEKPTENSLQPSHNEIFVSSIEYSEEFKDQDMQQQQSNESKICLEHILNKAEIMELQLQNKLNTLTDFNNELKAFKNTWNLANFNMCTENNLSRDDNNYYSKLVKGTRLSLKNMVEMIRQYENRIDNGVNKSKLMIENLVNTMATSILSEEFRKQTWEPLVFFP